MTSPSPAPELRISSASKTFHPRSGPIPAILDVSVEVLPGEFVVVMGPSGCGKSTLLRIAAGLESPDSGQVECRARDAGSLAYAPQEPSLLPWRTLLQNAVLGIEISRGLDPAHVDRVRTLINTYGLRGFEDHLPHELSGGMKQRASLIRALGCAPKLLLCDEPFSQVDFVSRLRLSERLKRDCEIYNVSALFVTHNIEEAIYLGTRILVMSGAPGRIISEYVPRLSVAASDPVGCRRSPEFTALFEAIWNDIQRRYAG